jgi:hypothetical protein
MKKINNKYYSFNCRMCDESINLKFENISNNVTNYKCSLCSADNWVDPASNKFQEIEEEKFDKSLLPIIKEVKKEDNSELFKSKYEPMPLDFPKNTFKSIGLLSPKGHWGWNGTSWVSTTKKVLESVENSTTSSNAIEQKKTSKWVYIVLVLFFIGFINYMLPWKCAGCNEKITQNSAYNYRGALVDKDMWTGGKNELYHGRCWQADDLFK